MKSRKKATVALLFCTLFICTIFLIFTTTVPITSTSTTGQEAYSFQSKDTSMDPTILINGMYYNITWFEINNETVTEIIENSSIGSPLYLNISWNNDLNRSVAMSFNTTDDIIYFNGVQLYIGYNSTPPDLRVELRNGTEVDSKWVPSNETNSILLYQEYNIGNFTQTGDWVTLLNETPIKLAPKHTYFILLRLNQTTSDDSSRYYSWRCTPDSGTGSDLENEGFARVLEFSDIDDINDTSSWATSADDNDCWMIMNFTKLQHTLKLQLPINWTLDWLLVDVFNSTGGIQYNVSDSVEGNVTGGTDTLTVNIPNGDRMYLAVVTFTDIEPVSWLNIIEDKYNSDGYAHTAGNMSEAQRFTLPHDSENLTIQILIRNTGLTENLVAEIWNATFVPAIGAYNITSNVTGVAMQVPYQNVTSEYEWLTLNFTGYFSEGDYYLVIHTENWTGDPSGIQFYDWASHSSAFEIPPPEGFEIWTPYDDPSDWNWMDVRDPYGNRYWHCMKVESYSSTDTEEIDIWVNNELVGDNGEWNETIWIPIEVADGNNVTFTIKSNKDITYNLDYNLYYYNYSDGLSNDISFYINDYSMINSTQDYWYQYLTGSQLGYNSSTGTARLVFKAINITSGEWTSTSINASISAMLSYTKNESMSSETIFTGTYTHESDATISLSQESMYIDYSELNVSAVATVYLNGTLLTSNWTDSTTVPDEIRILKNAFESTSIGQEISNGDFVNITVQFYAGVNIESPILPYKNESVTLNITNVLDIPTGLNVTIIRPDGTINITIGTRIDSDNWSVTFTPEDIGIHIASITTQSAGGTIIRREITTQSIEDYYYTFNVYQLGAGLTKPDVNLNETLTKGKPYKLQIWIRYLPSASAPPVNVSSLKVLLNNVETTNNATYNNNTGLWELWITSNELSTLGNLNITLNVTDNASRNIIENFTVQVVPPTLPSPIPILSTLTGNAANSSINIDTIARITTIVFMLLIVGLIFMRAFYPDTLEKIHKKLMRRP
ncbi:MAG: hypothetical protein ACETWM_03990 [Candidatus Lokiarchaeia archaeon]